MAIVGLDDDYYCVHTPIPVRRTGVSASTSRLQIYVNSAPQLAVPPLLCIDLTGDFLLDLSPWVRQFMSPISCNLNYSQNAASVSNAYVTEMEIELYDNDASDSVTKSFVHCSDDGGVMDDDYGSIKAWQCYPFSYMVSGDPGETNNLFSLAYFEANNEENEQFATLRTVILTLEPSTQYTVSSNASPAEGNANVYVHAVTSQPHSASNGVYADQPRTITTNAQGEIAVTIRATTVDDVLNGVYWVMMNEGTNADTWTPNQDDVTPDNVYTIIPMSDTFEVPGKTTEYDNSCCKGTYVKWLNDHGYYSYWLFKNSRNDEIESNEIFSMPEDIFANPRVRGRVTAGFDATDVITVRDKILRPYWSMLRSLVYSPDVYVLREDYEMGDDVTPSDWLRVRQDSPSVDHESVRSNVIDFEIDLILPGPYTIKRI